MIEVYYNIPSRIDYEVVIKNNVNYNDIKWGELHREEDLPAIIWSDGSQFWYKNGQRHRDGDPSGDPKLDLPAIIWPNGTKEWYKNGQLHREGDLPALSSSYGLQVWYKNGQLHRDGDLPALISLYGTKFWYKNGQRHRDGDLPAIIYTNGTQYWYKNNKKYKNFDLSNLKSLQFLIRILYFSHNDKMKYSPKNLIGIFVKKQLFDLITKN